MILAVATEIFQLKLKGTMHRMKDRDIVTQNIISRINIQIQSRKNLATPKEIHMTLVLVKLITKDEQQRNHKIAAMTKITHLNSSFSQTHLRQRSLKLFFQTKPIIRIHRRYLLWILILM